MFRSLRTSSRFVVVFLLLFGSSAQAQQKLLRWKLQPGETLDVSFAQETQTMTSIMGTELKSAAHMGMVLRWKVAGVAADGTADISQSIQRLTMHMDNPGGEPIRFDSASHEEPVGLGKTLAQNIQPLVGVEFTQTMNNRGEILEVALSPSAKESLAKAPTGAQLTEVFSKEGLKSLLHQAATVLPEAPVSPGDSWPGQSQTKSPVGLLVMNMTYTYRGTQVVEGKPLERIDVAVGVEFGQGPNALGLNVAVKEQQNAGTLYFDASAGRFTHTELTQNMTLETTIGEKVHRQQLNTQLRMQFASVSSTPDQIGMRPSSRR